MDHSSFSMGITQGTNWVTNNIAATRQIYAQRADAADFEVMEDLAEIGDHVSRMFLDDAGLDGTEL